MGRGGQGAKEEKEVQEFSWNEVRKHSDKDKWLVINGEVYNITNWVRRHPGGSRVISHYAGQDATDAFRAFHNDLNAVRKYLKPIHLGSVKPDEQRVEEIDSDFRNLREVAEKMDLFKPSYAFFFIHLAHIIAFEVLGYLVLRQFGTGWIPYLICLMCNAIVQAQSAWLQHDFGHLSVFKNMFGLDRLLHYFTMGFLKAQTGWLQHDFGHLSVFKKSKWDHFFHYLTVGFLKGASPHWWNHMHYQHHAKPNVMDKDPDVRVEALFVIGKQMPVKIAQTKKKSMPYNWQHHYFFIVGPPLLFPVYFQIMLLRHIFTRKLWLDLVVVMMFFTRLFILYYPLLGWGVIPFYFTVRCLESHWFTWVAQSNHVPMDIKTDEAEPWLKLQMHATCNVERSVFNDWFTGHLNFQIEHHLFPTMPRHNLYKIAPLVKSLCEKHGVSYQVKSLRQAFVDIVKTLRHSGELWYSTYKAFHSS